MEDTPCIVFSKISLFPLLILGEGRERRETFEGEVKPQRESKV